MMNAIREWIVTILSIIIFVTFVEFLLPNNNHRRYINVIIGLMIMLVILRPLLGLVKGGVNLSDGILQTTNQMETMTMKNRLQTFEVANQETVIHLYRENVKNQMKNRLEKQLGYRVYDVEVFIEEKDNDEFGMIRGVNIILVEEEKKEEPEKKEKRIKDIKVAVNVNVSLSEKNYNNVRADGILLDSEEEDIKNDFSSFYQVSKENINISVLKSN